MSIHLRELGRIKIINLKGKLTFDHGANELRQAVQQLVDRNDCNILLNLKDVRFMDSIGLEALLICHRTVGSSNGRIKLSNLSTKNRHLLEITNLLNVFDIYENEEEAISSFDT